MKRVLVGVLILLLVFAMIGSFCACSKSDRDSVISQSSFTAKNVSDGATVQKVVLTTDRMMVYTVNLALTVPDFPEAAATIRAALDEAEGYEQQSYTSNDGVYRFTFRVPTVNLNAFLEKVGKTGAVEEQTISGEDITDRYLNAAQERDALIAKKEAFEALASQATTFDEQLKIQDKILEVAAEIDRYNDRLSSYKKSSDYSTVEVTFYEEGTYEEPGFWERLGKIFFGSTKSIGTLFGVLLTVIVALIPYAILLGALFGVYALIRLIICRAKKQPFTLFRRRKTKYQPRTNKNEPTTPTPMQNSESADDAKTEEE